MEQLYFTACPAGHGTEPREGLQAKRRTQGYPGAPDTRHLEVKPFLPGGKLLVPPLLRYRREGDEAELIAIAPRATEFDTERGAWGKPGGFFTHAIRIDQAELEAVAWWPAGLYQSRIWCAADPQPTEGQPPDPLPVPIGPGALTRPPTFDAAQPLADGLTANMLAGMLAGLAEAVRGGRTLTLLASKPDRLADLVAVLTFALPGALRSWVTFSTYADKPEELLGYRLQGTVGPRSRMEDLGDLGPVVDLDSQVVHMDSEPPHWASRLAVWLVLGGPDERAAWEAFALQAGLGETPNRARDAWSDLRLDRILRECRIPATAGKGKPSAATPPRGAEAAPEAAPGGRAITQLPDDLFPPDAPEAATRAIGIDLGTTYSLVAYLDPQGNPVSVPSGAGDLLTPSVVLFEDDGVVVGKEAVAASVLDPEAVAECVKRDMGAKQYQKLIRGKPMPPEVISSLILRKLKEDAERVIGPIKQAVVTVPAYFDEPRRRATIDSGQLAGLEVLEILNEPTAAALAFAHRLGLLDPSGTLKEPMKALVYDLGGGTFDVTVVELKTGSFRAIATDGDVFLGGKDWDQELVNLLAERYEAAKGQDPRSDPVSLQELRIAAEAAKRAISERHQAPVIVNHRGVRHKVEVTRADFEARTEGLVERTRATTEIVIRQANLSWADIDRVLLVGGSTRMPMIRAMLADLTGKPPDASLPADEVVAMGAAVYAGIVLRREGRSESPGRDFSVTNVNSHSLGLLAIDTETKRKINRILIPKNTPLPAKVAGRFQTHRPGQKSVKLSVMEGDSEQPSACTHVGDAVIRGLPPGLPAGFPVQVKYTYRADGTLEVRGTLVGHKAAVKTEFQRVSELSDDEYSFWVEHLTARRNRLKL
ncbi:MAG: Hsp70 family protein [Isosphaeraceae bacterium]